MGLLLTPIFWYLSMKLNNFASGYEPHAVSSILNWLEGECASIYPTNKNPPLGWLGQGVFLKYLLNKPSSIIVQ